MDQASGQEPVSSADAEELRRAAVLRQLAGRRRRRRWIAGLSAVAASAVVITGSVAAWSSQASAQTLANQIEAWHVDHDRAECELDVRIVSAVALQERAADVLRAAEHVPSAEALLGDRERATFGERRDALLRAIDDGGFVSDDDRSVARAWRARAAAVEDPTSFDVLAACLQDAEATRQPRRDVTPEQASELERELRALGDPRDFDDTRIDRLEAAIAQLEPTVVAVAASRADLAALEDGFGLAPEHALASVRDADAHIQSLVDALGGRHSPADVLDLVEALAMHVAAGWMAEAWQLEALGEREAAAALAAAATASQQAIADAAPRPITDRGPSAPRPARPPLSVPPNPAPAPGPVEPSNPAPPAPTVPAPSVPPVEPGPSEPVPSDPAPSDPGPTDPGPSDPGPSDPGPEPSPSDPPATDPPLGTEPSQPPPGG